MNKKRGNEEVYERGSISFQIGIRKRGGAFGCSLPVQNFVASPTLGVKFMKSLKVSKLCSKVMIVAITNFCGI